MENDENNPDDLDEGEKEETERDWETSKERIIALIDADQSMLATFADRLGEEDVDERSYLSWAIMCIVELMQSRIKIAPNDEIGIVFYSTRGRSESEELRPFDHVYEYVKLDVPDAATIRKLQEFKDAEFEITPGCSNVSTAPGRAAEDLRHGLWACWDIFGRRGGSSARVAKTILLFTNNQDPVADARDSAPHLREQLCNRARELGGLAVNVELIPLIQLAQPEAFDYAPFWRQVLGECAAAARGLRGALALDGEEVAALMEEQAESVATKLHRVRGVGVRTRNRKRPLAAMTWTLSPSFKIAVQLFALVQPMKKPSHKYVTRDTAEVATSSNALIDNDTGALLPAASHKAFVPPNKVEDRFPKVILSNSEVKELKAIRPRGLNLLGFKPMSCLQDHHQMAQSRFVYPDEHTLRGSTAVFAALHAACLPAKGEPQMAVCSYVRVADGLPSLVALLPQADEVDDEGLQVTPNGFHMIILPWCDDLRSPESDPANLAKAMQDGPPPRASEEQIAAAEALINAISLDNADEGVAFSSVDIPNPHLQRHFEVLEALALKMDPPPVEELDDETAPDLEGIDAHMETLEAFKLAVFGSLDEATPAVKGAKRKAADSPAGSNKAGRSKAAHSEAQKDAAEEYKEYDWQALADKADDQKAGLPKLTVAQLKVYLRYHNLPVSGNKPDLVGRIQEHVQGQI